MTRCLDISSIKRYSVREVSLLPAIYCFIWRQGTSIARFMVFAFSTLAHGTYTVSIR